MSLLPYYFYQLLFYLSHLSQVLLGISVPRYLKNMQTADSENQFNLHQWSQVCLISRHTERTESVHRDQDKGFKDWLFRSDLIN